VLPKPKSVDQGALGEISRVFSCDRLERRKLADPGEAARFLDARAAAGQELVLLDIGGYFAPALPEICARYPGQISGVVEDTTRAGDPARLACEGHRWPQPVRGTIVAMCRPIMLTRPWT
jgi:hypothetical protein